MESRLNQFIVLLKKDLTLFISISFGIFLFELFFQPFWPEIFNFNNKLLFVAGLAGIVFVGMAVVRIAFSPLLRKKSSMKDQLGLTLPEGFLITALCSVAIVFYLRYVGFIEMTFHLVFEVVLICLAPPVIIRIYDKYKELSAINEELLQEYNSLRSEFEQSRVENSGKPIEFISEGNSENLTMVLADVVFIRSADNYVEIMGWEESELKKHLLRNTMKNIEYQLRQFSNFVRCHRTCIVNTQYIHELSKSDGNYWLSLEGLDEKLPVSRQYILRIREILQSWGMNGTGG